MWNKYCTMEREKEEYLMFIMTLRGPILQIKTLGLVEVSSLV
jgi:hypothetical protein